ncbi:hypothetical protein IC582_014717 [Cucumis melo]|uniref:Uncharacterized protein LOC103491023 n=1 Tax=Cucumis melo TaxID=3656 RepID=A0ABM3KXJ8_CUCME|nr:uncharacterized protein LOC103491023 [Cucumis melo]
MNKPLHPPLSVLKCKSPFLLRSPFALPGRRRPITICSMKPFEDCHYLRMLPPHFLCISSLSRSLQIAAIFFLNYTIEATNSLKSKYHEVVELYKGEGISFLIGDNKPSQATLNVLQESIGAID